MKITLKYNDLIIEVFDDPVASESLSAYDNIYQTSKDKPYSPSSQHAILVYKGNVIISSAILFGTAGATTVTSDSFFIDLDNLIIRCSNNLFSLALPDLSLNWITEVDWVTCFSIQKYVDTFISHGEVSISRIDRNGNVLWCYGGADIFVCLYEGDPFVMHKSYIALTDFNGGKYSISYNGETLSYEP